VNDRLESSLCASMFFGGVKNKNIFRGCVFSRYPSDCTLRYVVELLLMSVKVSGIWNPVSDPIVGSVHI